MACIVLGSSSCSYPYAGRLFLASPVIGVLATHVVRVMGGTCGLTPVRGACFQLVGGVAVVLLRGLTPRNRILRPTGEIVGSYLISYAFFRFCTPWQISYSSALANTCIALLITQLALTLLRDFQLIERD